MSDTKICKSGFAIRLPVAKFDAAKGLVTGWAALTSDGSGQPVIDYQDEHSPLAELQKAAHSLMLEGGQGKAGEMHKDRIGDIVESMVVDKEKAKALGFGDGAVEGWAVTLKLRDPSAIERVQNGERSELSIHGIARKTPIGKRSDGTVVNALSDLTVDEISIVDQGASGNENAQPRIVIAKRHEDKLEPWLVRSVRKFFSKQEQPTMTLDEVMANLPEDQRNVILAALEAAKAPAAPAPAPLPVAPMEPVAMQADAEAKEEEAVAKALAAMPEPVRKRYEAAQAKAEAEETERVELKKRLDKIEQERDFDGFLSKARTLPFLAGKSTDQIAKMLQSVHKSMDAKDVAVVEKILEGANAAVEKSALFKTSGSGFIPTEDSPAGQLEAVAKSLMEKDPAMRPSAARVKAAEMHPDLYEQRGN